MTNRTAAVCLHEGVDPRQVVGVIAGPQTDMIYLCLTCAPRAFSAAEELIARWAVTHRCQRCGVAFPEIDRLDSEDVGKISLLLFVGQIVRTARFTAGPYMHANGSVRLAIIADPHGRIVYESDDSPDFTAAALLLVGLSLAYHAGFASEHLEIVKAKDVGIGDHVFVVAEQGDFRVEERCEVNGLVKFTDQYGDRRRFAASSSVVRFPAPRAI